MQTAVICLTLVSLTICVAQAAIVPSTILNVVARQRTDGSGKVDVAYDVSAYACVSVAISTDGGGTYSARSYITGDVGWVRPGNGRRIVWDAKADLGADAVLPNCKARITADVSTGGVYPGEMVYVPAGPFSMGNNGHEPYSFGDELPQHSVYLSGYCIGKYEVTRGEYRRFLSAGGYSNPAYWSGAGWSWRGGRTQPSYWSATQNWGSPPGTFVQTDNHPVVGVSYYEAEAFCNWSGGHLPTEAQWEKAARWSGGYPRVYTWGDAWDAQNCNNGYDSLYLGSQTAPIGSYPSGASPCGCMDMTGNVWEWVQDWYTSYPGSDSPFDGTGISRARRGGGWFNVDYYGRCAYRSAYPPSDSTYSLGFRLAR